MVCKIAGKKFSCLDGIFFHLRLTPNFQVISISALQNHLNGIGTRKTLRKSQNFEVEDQHPDVSWEYIL